MKFISYEANATPADIRFAKPLHADYPRGYAYEIDTHFVHLYGQDKNLWSIQKGLTVTQGTEGDLRSWVTKNFGGATPFPSSVHEVGHTISHIWRPGISDYDDIRSGLNTIDLDRREALQAIRLQLERLDEITLFIEPTPNSLSTYSHKTRELLILACTEVENAWKAYMVEAGTKPKSGRDFKTEDYVRLLEPLYLNEFQLKLKAFRTEPTSQPFQGWSAAKPSQSLSWYQAYNETKHDRKSHFDKATLKTCIDAVAANLVMFSVRFSPFPLYNEGASVSALFNQMFDISLVNPKPETFYLPLVKFPANPNTVLSTFNIVGSGLQQPWTVDPFILP
jgi:hypothetical protein